MGGARKLRTALRYVIRHPEKGIFVGYRQGARQPLWTATYGGGAEKVPTVSRSIGQRLIRQMSERRAKLVVCSPDKGSWASVRACMQAGIPGWIPDLPGADAGDLIWDHFVAAALKATDLDGPPGRMANHRFDAATS